MGTVNNDSCLEKIKERSDRCAVCGVPRFHKEPGAWGDEIAHDNSEHAFVDAGNEPIFVLRAQDVTMVETVQHWLKLNPDLPTEKRDEAVELLGKVLSWPKKKTAD
jgi:hypothetical protein